MYLEGFTFQAEEMKASKHQAPLTPEDVAKFNELRLKQRKSTAKLLRTKSLKEEWKKKPFHKKYLPTRDNLRAFIGAPAVSAKELRCPALKISAENCDHHFSCDVEHCIFDNNALLVKHEFGSEDRFTMLCQMVLKTTQIKKTFVESDTFVANGETHFKRIVTSDKLVLPVVDPEVFLRLGFYEVLFHAKAKHRLATVNHEFVKKLFYVGETRLKKHLYSLEVMGGETALHEFDFIFVEFLSELFALVYRIVFY